MKTAATTPAARRKEAAGKTAPARSKVARRPLPKPLGAEAPLVRADLKRPPARLSTSLLALARAALKQPRKTASCRRRLPSWNITLAGMGCS